GVRRGQRGVGPAADGRAARIRRDQAEQHAQRGGLARAVRTEEPGDGAGLDGETQLVDRPDVAERLDQLGNLYPPRYHGSGGYNIMKSLHNEDSPPDAALQRLFSLAAVLGDAMAGGLSELGLTRPRA